MKNTPFCISYNNASHLSFKREQNQITTLILAHSKENLSLWNTPLFNTLMKRYKYTQKKISVLNLLKKKPIEIVDLQICKEKTNTMPFRVNNRP